MSAQGNDERLGNNLNQLLKQLDDYILPAPLEAKFQRVKQAQLWVDALDAYASLGSLNINEPISKLSDTELSLLNELTIGVAALTGGKKDDPTAATRDIVARMPVVKNQFTALNSQPFSYYLNADEPLVITFKGQFPLLLKDTTEVYLSNGAHKVGYTTANDTAITFQFTKQQLGLTNTTPMEVARIELVLVGQIGKKVNKRKQFTSVYHLYAIALPSSPGKLTITQNNKSKNTEKQNKRTRTFLLNGSKGNLVEKQCIPLHEGWVLLPETVELVVESSAGTKNRDWSFRKTATDGKICFTTEVFYNSAGTSGKLEYHLKYDIQRNISSEQTDESEIVLAWGENKQYSYNLPISKVVFTNFLGEVTPITGSYFQCAWLELQVLEKNIVLKSLDINTQNIIP
ncbi:hypothetical protein BH09BAC1_BH09BAC1_15190 [soil metagenome]